MRRQRYGRLQSLVAHGATSLIGLVVLLPTVGRGAVATCVGDCDSNGAVAVNELVAMVDIALDVAPVSTCSAGDANQNGAISIDELVAAVSRALLGCTFESGTPTPGPRTCTAADALCQPGQGGSYCCTLNGSFFGDPSSSDPLSGCDGSGLYVNPTPNATPGTNGCWTAPDGPCHTDFVCLVVSSPTPTQSVTPTVSATPTVTLTPTVTVTPPATSTGTAAATLTATPTVQPCDSAQTTACSAVCGDAQFGCCFNPTPAATGSPTPVVSCFDPSIQCAGSSCPDGWYGFTVCGGQGFYTDACQILTTPGATATPTPSAASTATDTPSETAPTATPTDTGTAGATATPTDTTTPAGPTATATPTPTAGGTQCAADQRSIEVTNNSGDTTWIGVTGGAVVPICHCPTCAIQACLAAPSLVANGHCRCAASDPIPTPDTSALLCPGSSTASADGSVCVCGTPTPGTDCGSSAECNTTTDKCYWQVPDPTSFGTSQWELENGQSALFCLPAPAALGGIANPVWWSGNLFARTGCHDDGTLCDAGNCTDTPDANCPAGTGGSGGHTLFETTMQTTVPDYYDVSLINGANVAITVEPAAGAASVPSGTDPAYWCGQPGSAAPVTAVTPCGWQIDPRTIPITPTPGTDYRTSLLQTSCPSGQTTPATRACRRAMSRPRVRRRCRATTASANAPATTTARTSSSAEPSAPTASSPSVCSDCAAGSPGGGRQTTSAARGPADCR